MTAVAERDVEGMSAGGAARSPFFSVLVPTYNQADYLEDSLSTLIGQTDPDWEAIVVNDGSTDGTREVLAALAAGEPRIRVVNQSNGGVAAALNTGLAHARGEWICWLSSDDRFDTRKLNIHRECIAEHPESRFFFSKAAFIDEAGQVLPLPPQDHGTVEWRLLDMLLSNRVPGNSICVRRTAFDELGGFDMRLRYAQDYDMWLRLMARYPATFIPYPTSITRLHPRQGTALFFEATSYDSARAAIQFLNRTAFPDLCPSVDFDSEDGALLAIVRALRAASLPTGVLYALGPHPALIARVVEWVWCSGPKPTQGKQKALIRFWFDYMANTYRGSLFGALWLRFHNMNDRALARVCYKEIDPLLGATFLCAVADIHGWENQESLGRYLHMVRSGTQDMPESTHSPLLQEPMLSWFSDWFVSSSPGSPTKNSAAGSRTRVLPPLAAIAFSISNPLLLRSPDWWVLLLRHTFPGRVATLFVATAVPSFRRLLRRFNTVRPRVAARG